MTVILYMAISADGFIATPKDETPWSDASWEAFRAFVKTCDVVLLGRHTYEIMRDQDEFINGPEYIVVTSYALFNTGRYQKINIKTKADLPKAVKIGVIGGGELNGRLAKIGVLDEIILDVEPIILGNGIRLFGDHDVKLKLELSSSEKLKSGALHNRYHVIDNAEL